MSLPVLICDDSALARKSIARALPSDWPIDISYAENGVQGIEAIQQGKGDVVFLDLNMPVLDGYQVLDRIAQLDLPTIVIVVSGDIQPEALNLVRAKGAIDFITKPIQPDNLIRLLSTYGIYSPGSQQPRVINDTPVPINLRDAMQEVANVAMGRAGDLLARLLDVFVLLPIPNVNTFAPSELEMALCCIANNDDVSAVSQGFISSGISGEALIIFHDASFADMAKLLKYDQALTSYLEVEVMNDISNILIGAFLSGLSDQLNIHFSQGQPSVLGQHCRIEALIEDRQQYWQKTLAIEVNYSIKDHNIKCDLLLLFTEDSIAGLTHKIGYLLN